jgi:high-affinity nickel-transport protein
MIGTIEVLGILPTELHWRGGFWHFMKNFNINTAGFAIVAMFLLTWLGAVVFWRVGHVEQKWGSRLRPAGAGDGSEHAIDGGTRAA